MMKHWRSIARLVFSVVAFFATLTGGAYMLSRMNPFGDVPTVREKWAFWKENKDQFDTIFIGTSRTYRGIMPAVFDQLTAEAGVPTKSFNFGVDGMFPPEDAFVAETILSRPPKNLRWVFLEMGVFNEDFEDREPDNIRSVYWHDLPRTLICTRAVLWPKRKSVKWKKWFESKEGKPTPADVTATHWRLFFSRSLNLGRGTTELTRMALKKKGKINAMGKGEDGFKPMGGDGIMRGAELETYEKNFAKRMETPARIVPLNSYAEESVARVLGRIRELGAQPVVFLAPTTGHLRGHPSEAQQVPIFDLCDLEAYPELFEVGVRTDIGHVNAIGAERFTRRVAEKFVELAKTQPPTR